MRSTDGLRPKIGRVSKPAEQLNPPQRVAPAQLGLKTAPRSLVREGVGAALPEEPIPSSSAEQPAPSYGLNRGTATAKPGQAGNPDEDMDWDRVISIFKFLLFPALFAVLIVIVGVKLPKLALYGVAGLIGLAAMVRARKDPEILLALMLIYIPFAHLYAISIAPLVNGTNIFILICLFAGLASASNRGDSAFVAKPGFKLIVAWFVISSASLLTLVRTPGALSYTLGSELTQYTAWISQAGFYLAVYSLVKTRGQAKRAMVYVMFGTAIVVLFGLREVIEKAGLGSIEKQRLGGVFEQPNDFGGFIAYTFLPFVALFLFNMGKIKAWVLTPYFLVTIKVLITTFSRGAYVAFAVGGFVIGWMRGKAFLLGWGIFALALVAMFPQVLPDSVLDRLNQTGRSSKVEKLDKSSEDRLILWDAAIEMTLENPFTGKGFKAFPYLKGQYTRIPVREGDPHNMYLYISSQMGVPALLLFLGFMAHLAWMGLMVYRKADDSFERVIGASMVAVIPCIAFINLFGSRMVGMSYVGYFYTMAVIVQVLYAPYAGLKRVNQMGDTPLAEAAAQSPRQPPAPDGKLGQAATPSPQGAAQNSLGLPHR